MKFQNSRVFNWTLWLKDFEKNFCNKQKIKQKNFIKEICNVRLVRFKIIGAKLQ